MLACVAFHPPQQQGTAEDKQELTCSICLDLFTDPVSTPCGHNFCQVHTNNTHSLRPQLSINKVFAVITENYKISRYGNATASSVPANSTNPFVKASNEDVIWCDVCTGIKQPAVSSCLTCTAAYCAEHVRPHHNTPFYAKHPLMDPQQALRGRTCSLHRRLLEVRGWTAQHDKGQADDLGRAEDQDGRCQGRSLCFPTHVASIRERGEVETLLDEAASSLDRLRAQVVGGVQQQMGAVLARGEGQVSLLEAELGQLTDRRAQLETQAVSQDHIGFLQSFSEATSPLGSDEPINVDDLDLNLYFNLGGVKAALAEVRDRMEDARLGGGGGGARGSVASRERRRQPEIHLGFRPFTYRVLQCCRVTR
uniref:Bloodthirsty-related gene family, member 30 n=1 Tax=Hippocampus comes TaxID=109280 RepID=A0A3Q2YIR1_HIPCM